jgi:hypothetical protein
MATYKVWLTVKDSYGNTKEVDGGTIDVNLAENLTTEDITHIENALPLEDYLKKSETDYLATDTEVEHAVKQNDSIKYSDLKLRPESN